MPGEAFSAGGNVVGGYMQAKATDRATKENAKATAAALAFEKEREANRQRNYAAAMDQYKQQWQAWNSGRLSGLQHYGFDIGPYTQAMGASAPVTSPAAAPTSEVPNDKAEAVRRALFGPSGIFRGSYASPAATDSTSVPLKVYAAQPTQPTFAAPQTIADLIGRNGRPMVS